MNQNWMEKLSLALGVSQADLLVSPNVVPGGKPRPGYFVQDDVEIRLLNYWRTLSPQAQEAVLLMLDSWANDRFRAPGGNEG